ncbi:MAG: 2-oxoglutarate dehydrogenase complex dihydrolipoyllysine-residue succinyltransferase [Bacteroidia bacterium]
MNIELKIPAVGESISEVTISKWLKRDGDYVEMDEPVAEIESDKATVELNATHAGTLKILAPDGSDIKIGAIAATINTDAKAPLKANLTAETKPEIVATKPEATASVANYATGTPSPAAVKILAEKGINTIEVNGTGKDGRITKEDASNASAKPIATVSTNSGYGNTSATRNQRSEKMSNLRKAVAKRLVAAKNETAMLTTFNEVNMQPIMDIRTRYKEKFKEKHGVGLGFMSFFTRACVLALQKFQAVNAYIDGTDIIYNDFCDISIAVSGPKGLMVPVMRNMETASLWDIEKQVAALATKARDNKLSIEEMTGGTFTISNGGVFGSMLSTPIINPPQSAILGMHNIIERPVAEKGQVIIRPMMYVALSYDHRIIDGRESVGFLVNVKQLLENPELMLTGKDPLDTLMGM